MSNTSSFLRSARSCLACLALTIGASMGDPWGDYEKSTVFTVGPQADDPGFPIEVRLLEPMAVHGSASGSSDGTQAGEVEVLYYYTLVADHGFLLTESGDFFVDYLYAGNLKPSDKVLFGRNRLWVNGVPRQLVRPTKEQERIIYDINDQQDDGLQEFKFGRWKMLAKAGGGSGYTGYIPDVTTRELINVGLWVVRIEGEQLYVQGIPYGTVQQRDEIRITDGAVAINGKVHAPKPSK